MIKTSEPVLQNPHELTIKIARFWDQISEGWEKVWGTHIHHGFYPKDETSLSPDKAQINLIIQLIDKIHLFPGANILDVGCGLGGSSLYLASNYDVDVTGITLSPKQVELASQKAVASQFKNVHFRIENALSLKSIDDDSIDIVWSLESCEQFSDKALFLKQAHRVLKPRGQLLLATWCSSQEEFLGLEASKYKKICKAFDVPYMPTISQYNSLLKENNFTIETSQDWTESVKKSWEIGLTLLDGFSFLNILRMSGWRGLRFANQIKLMRNAYHDNQIQYGVFVARKKY